MDSDFDHAVQKQLDAAMPWVGLYIAAASAVCILAMVADAVSSFRQKKLWCPCKYTSLNAASLTVLAVAMKLPMDLNTVMIKSQTDAVAKFTSIFFMSTTVSNFMPSLGTMNDKEVLANVVGLGILVITITGNVCIQIIELRRFLKRRTIYEDIMMPLVLLLVSLATLVSLGVTVSTMKRCLKSMYEEKHREALKEDLLLFDEDEANFNFMKIDDQRREMMKYWVMAESSNPQFVMARSVVCTSSSIVCWFSYVILTSAHVVEGTNTNGRGESSYGIYTKWIVYFQSIGGLIAVIVAMLRWFVVVMFRCSTPYANSFKIEAYWIQNLKDWRDSFAGLQIEPNKWWRWKYLLHVKWCMLTFFIGVQIGIVLASKILVFFSSFIVTPFLFCFSHINKLVKQMGNYASSCDDTDINLNLSHYVLLLDGEAKLPTRFLRSMCQEADRVIQEGREKQPMSLGDLLRKSVNFRRSLVSEDDPSDCWTMPVVTLASIAVALPNVSQHKRKQLLSSVSEGLSLTEIVEKTLDARRAQLIKNIRNAASVAWVELLLYSKWLDIDLGKTFLSCEKSDEVLRELGRISEEMVMGFMRDIVQDSTMGNPLNWPVKVAAANSMYRICQTILLSSHRDREEDGEEMFERLSVMIADTLASCLISLPRAITRMCHQNSIEKREKSVREAFLLLGKTEQVVQLVRHLQRPFPDDDVVANDGSMTMNNSTFRSVEHLDIRVDSF